MTVTEASTSTIGSPPRFESQLGVDEFRRHRDLKRFIFTLLIGLSISFLSLEFLTRFLIFVGKPALSANPQYDAKYLVAGTVSPSNDNIVLCGDSLVKQGLYPELIAARLQKINDRIRVVNLAVNGGSEDDAIAYLDYLRIRRCTKPRLLVFDYEVSSTGNGTSQIPGKAPSIKTIPPQHKGYLFDAKLSRPTEFLQTLALLPSDVSLLVRHRGTIKHYIFEFLSAFPDLARYDQRSTIELCNVDDAGTTYCGTSPDHNLIPPKDLVARNGLIAPDWSGSPQHDAFRFNGDRYSRIIKYCQEQQIPLMLVWLPHQNAMYEKCWYKAPYTKNWFRAQFENYAKKMFVFPVYLNQLPEDCTLFSDYMHLSTYGCMKASELLAEAIGQSKYRSLIEHHPSAVDGKHAP